MSGVSFDCVCSDRLSSNWEQFFLSEILVWYGCETWSVTFREEHRAKTFENRVLGEGGIWV